MALNGINSFRNAVHHSTVILQRPLAKLLVTPKKYLGKLQVVMFMFIKKMDNSSVKKLEKRINNLEQSKKKADEENQLLLFILSNEIDSNDLNNLRELLSEKKLTEILTEFVDRKQDGQILNDELSNLSSKFKYSEEMIEEQEKEAKTKQAIMNYLENKIKEQEESITKQKTIEDLKEMVNSN
ncbi:13255_t:CDS:2 [Funneliformis mosseae]|uniref:13255_t:CDS:1 n=1 Tax=Funneliformis mosseae TaxID=27381 RepID=A0A9N9H0H0_FUNMO|nr:13255_t:CDS:2 [Funneliformis mosseae]